MKSTILGLKEKILFFFRTSLAILKLCLFETYFWRLELYVEVCLNPFESLFTSVGRAYHLQLYLTIWTQSEGLKITPWSALLSLTIRNWCSLIYISNFTWGTRLSMWKVLPAHWLTTWIFHSLIIQTYNCGTIVLFWSKMHLNLMTIQTQKEVFISIYTLLPCFCLLWLTPV